MACNAGHDWCKKTNQRSYTVGEEDYCVFHAPKGHKKDPKNLTTLSDTEFNRHVFNIINTNIDFDSTCDLSGTIFPGDIDFSHYDKTHPLPSIVFNSAVFHAQARFIGTVFKGISRFSSVRFESTDEKIFLSGCHFDGAVYFNETEFNAEVDFGSSHFRDAAFFKETIFSQGANFKNTQFSTDADFSTAKFIKGRVAFKSAKFNGDVDFRHAQFNIEKKKYPINDDYADFESSTFHQKADFRGVWFFGMAKFGGASFRGEAFFHGGKTFQSSALLKSMILHEARNIRFEDVDICKVQFAGTDIRKFEFVNCKFPKNEEGKDVLFDEIVLGNKIHNPESRPELEKVELLYRRLKQRSKEEHNEPMVSHWHTREKEMQRLATGKRRWGNIFQWFFINAYWLSSGYGEDPKRAAWWLAIIVGLAVVMTGMLGVKPVDTDASSKAIRYFERVEGRPGIVHKPSDEFWRIPVYTLEDLSFQRGVAYEPANTWGRFFRLGFRLFAIIQFALFALALRNRFRR